MKMNEEGLTDLARELTEQDNYCTGYPIYLVQQKRRLYGVDPRYHDEAYVWSKEDDLEYTYSDEEVQVSIKEEVETTRRLARLPAMEGHHYDPEEHGYEKVFYIDQWEFVTAHLTERAARRYMEENAHNLNMPRVFVESQHRCHEWIAVVDYLKSLAPVRKYYVEYAGNRIADEAALWWDKGGGYTYDISRARVFTEDEIEQLVLREVDTPWPVDRVNESTEGTHVDKQAFHLIPNRRLRKMVP